MTEGEEEDTSASIEDLAGSSTDEDEYVAVAEDAQWEGAVETDDTDEVRRNNLSELLPARPEKTDAAASSF